MKTSFAVIFAVLFLSSLSNYAAEPSGKIAVRVISIVENRASDLSGENLDFPFMPGLSVALELSGPPIPKATQMAVPSSARYPHAPRDPPTVLDQALPTSQVRAQRMSLPPRRAKLEIRAPTPPAGSHPGLPPQWT